MPESTTIAVEQEQQDDAARPALKLSSAPLVARNALLNLSTSIWLAALALFTTPYIVHHLGTDAYGLLVMVSAVSGYFAMLDLGLIQAVVKYASEYYGRGDYARLGRLVGTANLLYLGLGMIGGLAIVASTNLLVTRVLHLAPDLRAVAYFAFYLAALGFLVNMPLSVFNAIPTALQRMDITNLRSTLIGTGNGVGAVVLLSFGFGLRAVLILNVTLTIAGVIAFVVASRRLLPGVSFRARFDREEAARLWRFALPVAASSAGARVTAQLDRLLVGMFWPMSYVTYYTIPVDVCRQGMSLVTHVTGPLFPAVSDRAGSGDMEAVRRMYLRAIRLLAAAVMPVFVLLIVFAHALLKAWMGEEIARHSALVLSLAAGASLVQVISTPHNTFLSAMGRPGLMAKWNLVPGAAAVLLNLLLIPRLGAVGAALALLLVSVGSGLPYAYVVASRVLQVPPRRLFRAVAGPVGLALACAAPAALARSHLTSLPVTLATVAGTFLLYAATGLATGVVPRADVALAWGVVVRRGRPQVPSRSVRGTKG